MVDDYSARFSVTQGDTSGLNTVNQLNKSLEKAQDNTLKVGKYTTNLSDQYAKLRREKAPEELARKYAELAAETGNSRTALLQLSAEMRKIDASNEEITRVARTFDREYTAAVKRAEVATEKLRQEQERQAKEGLVLNARKATLSRDNIGDISTFTSEAAGLVPGVGGEALRATADITGLLEYSSNFQQSIKNAATAAQNASGVIGGLANAGAAVAGVIPGVSAGFGALVAVVAPFAVALGAMAIGFNKLQESAKGVNEANKAFFARQQAEADFLNSDLTTEQAKKRKVELETIIAQQEQILASGDANLAQSFAEAQQQFGDFGARIGTLGLNLGGGFNDFNEGMSEANSKLGDARSELAALNPLLEENAFATNDAAEAERALAAERNIAASQLASNITQVSTLLLEGLDTKGLEQQIDATSNRIDATTAALRTLRDQGLKDTDAFRELEAQLKIDQDLRARLTSETTRLVAAQNTQLKVTQDVTKAISDFNRNEASEALQDSLAASDAAVDAVNKEADAKFDLNRRLVQQQLAHNENLANIAKRGNEQVAQLQEQLASKITANNAAIGKLQDDYQKSETKAREEYLRRRNAIEQAADQSALDAKINNDATALARIRAQEQADLGELDTGEQLRADEAKAQLEERVATLRAETEAFKLEIQARIIETQNQTTAAIAEAQKQYDARLKLDEEERRIKEQRAERDAQLAEQRRVRNEQLEQAAQDAALASTLAGITAKSEAELAAMQSAIDAALSLEQVGIRLQSSFGGLLQSVTNPVTKALENAYNGGADKPYTQSSGYDPYQGVLPPVPTNTTVPPANSTPFAPSAIPSNTQLPNSLIPTLDKVASSAPPPNVYITVESPTVGDVASKSVATAIAEEIADKVAAKYQKITVDGIRIGNRKAATRRS